MPLLVRFIFLGIDMELAMKTLAQIEEGHAMHVEVVSAPRTPSTGSHCCKDTKEYHPNYKNRGRNLV